jgi:hypothetical protein
MESVAERDAMRRTVLAGIRDDAASRGAQLVDLDEWAQAQGIEPDVIAGIARWAVDRGYLDRPVGGQLHRLTPAGEDLLEELERTRLRKPADRNEERARFLEAAYDATSGGRRGQSIRVQSVPGLTGMDAQAARDAFDYLSDAGLVKAVSLGGSFEVTHLGVRQVEEWRQQAADENEDKGVEAAAPLASAAPTAGVAVVVLDSNQAGQLEALLTDVRRLLDDEGVCPPSHAADDLQRDLNDASDLLRNEEVSAPQASWAARALRSGLRAAATGVTGNRADAVILKLWDWATRIAGLG